MFKALSSLIILILLSSDSQAATSNCATEIEVDPIAYALRGYSIHLGERFYSFKVDANVAGENLTESQSNLFFGSTNFKVKGATYGAKLDLRWVFARPAST